MFVTQGMPKAYDMVTFTQVSPPGPSQRVHLAGDDTLAGGTPQYDVLKRPRRRDGVAYVGQNLHTLKLPLVLDGFGTGADGRDTVIDDVCDLFAGWMEPAPGLDPPRPAALTVVSTVVRQPRYHPWWQVTDIDWTVGQIRDASGRRVQQQIVLSLQEFVAPVLLLGPAARDRAAAGQPAGKAPAGSASVPANKKYPPSKPKVAPGVNPTRTRTRAV